MNSEEVRILDFLENEGTCKIAELEYNLDIPRERLMPLVLRLESDNKLTVGSYRNSDTLKFVRLGPWRSEEDRALYGCPNSVERRGEAFVSPLTLLAAS